MALILYTNPFSPPSRAVQITAKLLEITLELKEIDLLVPETLNPEFIKLNPQHTIPLLNDNGIIIWESHAIMPYLVAKYGKDDTLYPKDLVQRAVVDQRLHFETGILFPTLREMFLPIVRKGAKTVSEESREKAEEAYDFLDKFLEGKEWITGPSMTIGDISIFTTTSQMSVLKQVDPEKYPNLTEWMKKMKNSPCTDMNQEVLEKFQDEITKFMS